MDKPKDQREAGNTPGDNGQTLPAPITRSEEDTKAHHPNNEKPQPEYIRHGLIRRGWEEFKNAGTDRHLELLLTFAIVIFAGLQLIITVVNSNTSGKQMTSIIDAANRIDNAADSFSSSASEINKGISNAVIQLSEQVGASKTIASAASTSARTAQVALQPAIGTNIVMGSVENGSMKYQLNIRNEGGSSADVTLYYCALSKTRPSPLTSIKDCGTKLSVSGTDTILAHSSFPIAMKVGDFSSSINIADIIAAKTSLLMPIKLTYPVGGKTRILTFCYVYEPVFKSMGECSDLAANNNTQ